VDSAERKTSEWEKIVWFILHNSPAVCETTDQVVFIATPCDKCLPSERVNCFKIYNSHKCEKSSFNVGSSAFCIHQNDSNEE
jgi:hypothetical protein